MNKWLHAVLHILGLAGTALVPVLAASGVGIPAAVVAGAAIAGGVALKLAPSPITPQSIEDAVDSAVKR